jgi:hypothetical protein
MTKDKSEKPIESTQANRGVLYYPPAFHEAGHVVVAYFLGVRFKKVSIIHNKDYVGIVIHEKVARGLAPEIDMSLRNFNRMENLARIALAGDIAQKKHAPRSSDGAGLDRETVADIALRLNGSPEAADAWIEWLKISVKDMLTLRWPFVDAVARELARENVLNGEQIEAIFTRHLRA